MSKELEGRARELAEWLHRLLCTAQKLPWEEGDCCAICVANVKEFAEPLLIRVQEQRLRDALQELEDAYCGCDLMKGYTCRVHERIRKVREAMLSEPAAPAPALGRILGTIHNHFNDREPYIGAWDEQRIVVAEVITSFFAERHVTAGEGQSKCICSIVGSDLEHHRLDYKKDCPIHGQAASGPSQPETNYVRDCPDCWQEQAIEPSQPAPTSLSAALQDELKKAEKHGLERYRAGDMMQAKYWSGFRDAISFALLSAARLSEQPLTRSTELLIRSFLWQGHGHEGIYGDDGEMQCGECRRDYKRDSLHECVESARVASLEEGLKRLQIGQPSAAHDAQVRLEELEGLVKQWRKSAEGARSIASFNERMEQPNSLAGRLQAVTYEGCADSLERALKSTPASASERKDRAE